MHRHKLYKKEMKSLGLNFIPAPRRPRPLAGPRRRRQWNSHSRRKCMIVCAQNPSPALIFSKNSIFKNSTLHCQKNVHEIREIQATAGRGDRKGLILITSNNLEVVQMIWRLKELQRILRKSCQNFTKWPDFDKPRCVQKNVLVGVFLFRLALYETLE